MFIPVKSFLNAPIQISILCYNIIFLNTQSFTSINKSSPYLFPPHLLAQHLYHLQMGLWPLLPYRSCHRAAGGLCFMARPSPCCVCWCAWWEHTSTPRPRSSSSWWSYLSWAPSSSASLPYTLVPSSCPVLPIEQALCFPPQPTSLASSWTRCLEIYGVRCMRLGQK